MNDHELFKVVAVVLLLLPFFTYPTDPWSPVRIPAYARAILFILTAGLMISLLTLRSTDAAFMLEVVSLQLLAPLAYLLSDKRSIHGHAAR